MDRIVTSNLLYIKIFVFILSICNSIYQQISIIYRPICRFIELLAGILAFSIRTISLLHRVEQAKGNQLDNEPY